MSLTYLCLRIISISELHPKLILSILKRYIYYRDIRVRAREMSALERFLYQGGVHIRQLSVIQSCLYKKDICIKEILVSVTCMY